MSHAGPVHLEACERCGQLASTRVVFCPRCGRQLREPAVAPRIGRDEPVAAPAENRDVAPVPVLNYSGPRPPEPKPPRAARGDSGKSGWIAALLAIGIGIKILAAWTKSTAPPPRAPRAVPQRVVIPQNDPPQAFVAKPQPSPHGVAKPQPVIPDPNAPRPIPGTSLSVDNQGRVHVAPPPGGATADDW